MYIPVRITIVTVLDGDRDCDEVWVGVVGVVGVAVGVPLVV